MNENVSKPMLFDSLDAALVAAPEDAGRLADVLATEFEALKARDLEALEAVQDEKTHVLQRLAAVAEWAIGQDPVPAVWQQLQNGLRQCKQDHLRNIQLMQRQLDAVRGTLQSLQGESSPALDLYDRMGQVSRRSAVWGYHQA
jgi:flagellar biosynthesis/type III secretory pathway chaperone